MKYQLTVGRLSGLSRTVALGGLVAVMLCAQATSVAQTAGSFPNQPVRMVVPYPPGGPTDITARVVAAEMSKTIGQNIVIDNRPGASGMIGSEMVTKATPDGYTLLANASIHVINPSVYPDMRFDAIKDFTPVGMIGGTPHVLVINAALPVLSHA